MSGALKAWLVAYDIRENRRLRRVHRCVRKHGIPAQYSAFTVEADDADIEDLLEALGAIIDDRVDDVRAYHIPASCKVWGLGKQQWLDGVSLSGSQAVGLLTESVAMANDSDEEADPIWQTEGSA